MLKALLFAILASLSASTTAPKCKSHEVFDCTIGGCSPRTCSELGFPIPCTVKIDPKFCKKGCVCEDGYLRNDRGICIPKKNCPSCGGDPNAVASVCGNNCGNTCANYKKKNVACPEICKINSCECRKGYVYDENQKICVLPKKCTKSTEVDCSAAVQRFYEGSLKFTVNFLNDVAGGNPGTSVIMSPFSVLITLALCGLYTDESNSYKQIMSVLNLKNKDEIRCVFPEIIKIYQTQNQSKLVFANKIYVNSKNKLTEKFKEDSQVVFNAEGEAINFSNTQYASDTINKWVAEKTNNLIEDLANPGMFNEVIKLVLTNAIYFLGSWVNQFNPDKTSDRDFYVDENETKSMKTMFSSGSFRFADVPSLDAKVLEIPYKGGDLTYVAFLPNTNNGYINLVTKLQDTTLINNALDQLTFKKVDVYLPRYETTSSLNLILLEHLNVTDIFNAAKSNLNGIIKGSEQLFVSDAIHKAKIKVDEVGTEAIAGNAVVVNPTDPRETFDANHPFIYFIFKNRSPLFTGVVSAN